MAYERFLRTGVNQLPLAVSVKLFGDLPPAYRQSIALRYPESCGKIFEKLNRIYSGRYQSEFPENYACIHHDVFDWKARYELDLQRAYEVWNESSEQKKVVRVLKKESLEKCEVTIRDLAQQGHMENFDLFLENCDTLENTDLCQWLCLHRPDICERLLENLYTQLMRPQCVSPMKLLSCALHVHRSLPEIMALYQLVQIKDHSAVQKIVELFQKNPNLEKLTSAIDEALAGQKTKMRAGYDHLLTMACRAGNFNVVNYLLNKLMPEAERPPVGLEVCIKACQIAGNGEILRCLIRKQPEMIKNDLLLIAACRHMRLPGVELLLENGATVNEKIVFTAVMSGDVEIVKRLLDKQPTEFNETHLLRACETGYTGIAEVLLARGLTLREEDVVVMLPRQSSQGNYPLIKLLLDRHVVSVNTKTGGEALHEACKLGHSYLVKLLLDNGADIDFLDKAKFTPLMVACKNGHSDVAKLLLARGADIAGVDELGSNLLFVACYSGLSDVAELLIKKEAGRNINSKNIPGHTPLWIACRQGHHEAVAVLLDYGAEITPEVLSVTKNDDIKNTLLKRMHQQQQLAELRHFDFNKGGTALMRACAVSEMVNVYELFKKGEDINATDADGRTPLFFACAFGRQEIVAFLLNKDAHIDTPNHQGYTPLMAACMCGSHHTVVVLLKGHAAVDLQNGEGDTALMLACARGCETVIELLLDNHADMTIMNKAGKTALMMAREGGHKRVVDLLLKKEGLDQIRHIQNSEMREQVQAKYISMENFSDPSLSPDRIRELVEVLNDPAKDRGDQPVPLLKIFEINLEVLKAAAQNRPTF